MGLLLAAGAGSRMGRPKALVVGDDGEPWLTRGIRVLREGGCEHVVVVLGARAADARALLPRADTASDFTVVEAPDWHEGIGASLRTGLAAFTALTTLSASAALPASATDLPPTPLPANPAAGRFAVVSLVDLPHLQPEAVRRLAAGASESTLRQATYAGRPGHPVVIGAEHVSPLAASLSGDTGARPYLKALGVVTVDCTDLGGGDDVDAPPPGSR